MPQSNTTTIRDRLQNRRPAVTFDFEQDGLRFSCTYSQFADGRLAEVFLQNHKVGSQSDRNARDSAIAASLALQHGCPLQDLRRALPHVASPLAAALDVIARDQQKSRLASLTEQ
jgi:ribonucleoside-diphosphate reductase alpha chain